MTRNVPAENFSALTRLDHNRAMGQLAIKAGVALEEVSNAIIWGNHSSTQYPDINHATVGGKKAKEVIGDDGWYTSTFIPMIQKRGAAIIAARKLSSALSAAQAISDHMHDWVLGTPAGKYVSMAVDSTGNKYGVADGLIYSFPVTCTGGKWTIVDGLALDDFSKEKMKATENELMEEKNDVAALLKASTCPATAVEAHAWRQAAYGGARTTYLDTRVVRVHGVARLASRGLTLRMKATPDHWRCVMIPLTWLTTMTMMMMTTTMTTGLLCCCALACPPAPCSCAPPLRRPLPLEGAACSVCAFAQTARGRLRRSRRRPATGLILRRGVSAPPRAVRAAIPL